MLSVNPNHFTASSLYNGRLNLADLMGRNKLYVATTPPLFAKLGHVHPFRFTPESPDKTRRSVSMSCEGSALEGKVQIHVHKVRKFLDALSCL